jgi:hypothetical protein
MNRKDDIIMWRARCCGELQDREAPRNASPTCGSCGAPMIRFDEDPPAVETSIAAKPKRQAKAKTVEASPAQPTQRTLSGTEMAMIKAIAQLSERVEMLQNELAKHVKVQEYATHHMMRELVKIVKLVERPAKPSSPPPAPIVS